MNLLDLPVELYECILEEAVLARGVKRALRLRLVNKQFSRDVQTAIFTTGILDSHVEILKFKVPSVPFWGSYLAHRIFSAKSTKTPAMKEILTVAKLVCDANGLSRVESLKGYVNELCLLTLRARQYKRLWFCDQQEAQTDEVAARLNLVAAAAYLNCMPLVATLRKEEDETGCSKLFRTPIGAAAYRKNNEIVEFLLANTTGLVVRSLRISAVVNACWGGCSETFDLVLESRWGEFPPERPYAHSALKYGLYSKSPTIFRRTVELLKPHPTIKLHLALNRAAADGHTELVSYLLEIGTPPDGQYSRPLLMASRYGHFTAAKILLKYGADPNMIDGGTSSLAAAARGGYLSIVRLLLDNGAKINEGSVPAIYYALELEHTSMVHLLLERGALLSTLPHDVSKSLHDMGIESMAKIVAQEISNLGPADNEATRFADGGEEVSTE